MLFSQSQSSSSSFPSYCLTPSSRHLDHYPINQRSISPPTPILVIPSCPSQIQTREFVSDSSLRHWLHPTRCLSLSPCRCLTTSLAAHNPPFLSGRLFPLGPTSKPTGHGYFVKFGNPNNRRYLLLHRPNPRAAALPSVVPPTAHRLPLRILSVPSRMCCLG